jgi:hypothetical protein
MLLEIKKEIAVAFVAAGLVVRENHYPNVRTGRP